MLMAVRVPEWDSVQHAVQAALAAQPAALDRLGRCPAIAVYTDGSAPLQNPGGPAGSATIVLGFAGPTDPGTMRRPPIAVRLDIGAYIPARPSDPPTSNNRAEAAAILAALEVLRQRPAQTPLAQQITIWSDSQYVVMCANGLWKRKKNTDIWALFDGLAHETRQAIPSGFTLVWTKGHVGTEFNEAADDLATRAAFNFDAVPYQQFRAAQAATGREMPHPAAEVAAPQTRTRPTPVPDGPAPARVEDWVDHADYALVIYARPDNNGRTLGRYALFTRSGRSRMQTIHDGRLFSPDEADYHVLIAALTDLCARVTAREHDPGTYTLTLYSHRELVVKQLSGVYKVRAPALRPLYTEARGLLDRFKQADLVWRRDDSIKALLRSGAG